MPTASLTIGIRILFTTKPAASSTCTGVLPISSEIFLTASTSSGFVFKPAITSTSFITGAGLKKCIPITCLSTAPPISVMEREEVFVAKMQLGLQIASSSLNVCFLISMFSIAASTTRSQSPQISFTPVVILFRILSASS